jgi:hypothetical protein
VLDISFLSLRFFFWNSSLHMHVNIMPHGAWSVNNVTLGRRLAKFSLDRRITRVSESRSISNSVVILTEVDAVSSVRAHNPSSSSHDRFHSFQPEQLQFIISPPSAERSWPLIEATRSTAKLLRTSIFGIHAFFEPKKEETAG